MQTNKVCSSCNIGFVFSKKLCKYCWSKQYSKPIKKISTKQLKTIQEYSVIRKDFLKLHPTCQVKGQGCGRQATDIHHIAGKKSTHNWLSTDNFLSVCRTCHNWIHLNPKEATEKGFLKSSLK